ncbi:probable caffeoyl-CoA O-methyltransferase At4g26220 isoform X2 [Gossypium hirsutum]|uniref:Probable caffeoyl-CoA O-methyltransferase At4g26220 isoform X2 n=1 Tax=Gossypium hirsutum TaxID=3635 RepID=A0ABM3AJF0_GOSHI|nr:probable caffeoyl-CoA O-methyltransferase At4g26220 isoform X2 [Gossypium hirsutum]
MICFSSIYLKSMEFTTAEPFLHKGLLQSFELTKYILKTNVYPREPSPLKELREVTAKHPGNFMSTTPDSGQLMGMLLKLINAKKTIEIGVYTGYSLLLTALSIPHDAMGIELIRNIKLPTDSSMIIAIDPNKETYEIGLPIIQKAGVEHKINFIESQALPVLDKLLQNKDNEGSFDFAFVDADKENYLNYHERLLKLVKVGGLIVFDNTLWGGTVAQPEEAVSEDRKESRRSIIEFNNSVSIDQRIEIALTPSGDGLTICRRIR